MSIVNPNAEAHFNKRISSKHVQIIFGSLDFNAHEKLNLKCSNMMCSYISLFILFYWLGS